MPEARPRACDPCRLRKIRCNGSLPCEPCLKAEFECSFAKRPLKPGPKGPRAATSQRIKTQLKGIRFRGSLSPSWQDEPHLEDVEITGLQQCLQGGDDVVDITLTDVELLSRCLDIYDSRLYSVWPVVDRAALISRLRRTPQDLETRSLACAVSAATVAQLRMKPEGTSELLSNVTLSKRLAAEAERCRRMYDHRETLSIPSIMISFFLHAFYSAVKKPATSTILLREALTKCQIMGLHKEDNYRFLSSEERRCRCKIFWLLFITERGHAIQHENLPVVLQKTIPLPHTEDEPDPAILTGFLSLVKLFVAVEGTLVGTTEESENAFTYGPEKYAQLQLQLQQGPKFENMVNEVQTIDIRVTQQWMRILVWQLSVRNIRMTSSGEDALSLQYPMCVARDSMHFLSRVSLESLIAHGPGMVLKLFEIANSLLDVINCVPSLSVSPGNTMIEGPRDILHAFSCLLSSLTSRNTQPLLLLQEKMAKSTVAFPPVPRSMSTPEFKDESFNSSILLSPESMVNGETLESKGAQRTQLTSPSSNSRFSNGALSSSGASSSPVGEGNSSVDKSRPLGLSPTQCLYLRPEISPR